MPSASAAQHRAMEAAAHGRSTLGIPKSVGEEFVAKDDAPQAAGVVFASSKGRVLLMHRDPAEVNYGGHWGLPGGKAELGEDAEAAARREVKEETGYDHTGPLKPMDRVKTPNGMTFTTFAAHADGEFAPKMADGEHTGFTWADLQHLPRPLHPSVARTLGSHIGVTEDMTPEDWSKLKTGFAKWIDEEESEPDHAEDDASGAYSERDKEAASSHVKHRKDMPASAFLDPEERKYPVKEKTGGEWKYDRDLLLGAAREARMHGLDAIASRADAIRKREFPGANDSLAMDRDSVREFDKDSGHLRVTMTPISKATVNPYLGKEIPGWETMRLDPERVYQLYRQPDELAKAAATFAGKPLLIIHQASSADDHPREVTVGSVGDNVEFRAPYLMAPLTVWDGEAIDMIESGEQQELSCGYSYDPDMTPGVANGMKYDGVMRNLRGNHVALVSQGRAGPDVLVQDSALNTNGRAGPKTGKPRAQKGNHMSKETVRTARGALDAKAKDELEANSGLPMAKAKDKAHDEEPDKMEKLRAALKDKGASDDMIDAACDAILDDEDDEDQEAMDEDDDKEPETKANDDEPKDMVTKKAMDEAISSAVRHAQDEMLRGQREIREAEDVVRPYVGKLATVHDSAADVYRTALGALGVKNVDKLHPDALKPILLNMPLPGATARPASMTMDAAGVNSFYDVFPEAKAHQVKTI